MTTVNSSSCSLSRSKVPFVLSICQKSSDASSSLGEPGAALLAATQRATTVPAPAMPSSSIISGVIDNSRPATM